MVDDVNLIEDDTGIEDIKCGIVQSACKDDVFEELESVGVVDFPLNGHVAHDYRLMELSSIVEEITVVGFVAWEIWIICERLSGRRVMNTKTANILGCQRLQKITRLPKCVHTWYDHST